MPFTYSGDPRANLLDETRFLIQDTDPDDWFLSDDEINYLLNEHGTPLMAALSACTILIAKFARYIDEQTGKQTIYASQMQQHYVELKHQFERKIAREKTNVFFGGTNIPRQFSDKEGDNERVWRRNN